MKLWRCLLLMLLAVMIPARGAVAAAMMCPQHDGALTDAQHQQSGELGAHDTHYAHRTHAQEPGSPTGEASMHTHQHEGDPARVTQHGNDHEHNDNHAGSTSGGCQLCASVCSMTPMLGSLPTWQPPAATPSADFPPLRVPAPSFQSDGPERPPRRT